MRRFHRPFSGRCCDSSVSVSINLFCFQLGVEFGGRIGHIHVASLMMCSILDVYLRCFDLYRLPAESNFSFFSAHMNFRLSERSPFDGSCCGAGYAGGDDTKSCSSDSEPTPPPRYRVVLLGDSATGKTGECNEILQVGEISFYHSNHCCDSQRW